MLGGQAIEHTHPANASIVPNRPPETQAHGTVPALCDVPLQAWELNFIMLMLESSAANGHDSLT